MMGLLTVGSRGIRGDPLAPQSAPVPLIETWLAYTARAGFLCVPLERAPTEADAKERKQPIVVRLMVTASGPPLPSLVPPWNRRSPVLRGRGFSMAQIFIAAGFRRNKIQERPIRSRVECFRRRALGGIHRGSRHQR